MSKNPYMFVNYGLVSGDKHLTPYQGVGYDVYIGDISDVSYLDQYYEIAQVIDKVTRYKKNFIGFLSPFEAKEFYYDVLSSIRDRNSIIYPKYKRAKIFKRGALFKSKNLKDPFNYDVDFSNVFERHELTKAGLNKPNIPYGRVMRQVWYNNTKNFLIGTPHILWSWDSRGRGYGNHKILLVFKPHIPKKPQKIKTFEEKFEKYQKDPRWALEGKEARRI